MVHVAHDHHHGRTGDQVLLLVLGGVDELFLDGDDDFLLHLAAQFHGHQGGGVIVDDVAEGGHDAVFDEALDHLGPGFLHPGGQLTHADLVGDLHGEGGLCGDLQLEPAHLLLLLLAALVAEVPALAVVAPALDLLLAALHLVGPFRRQVFQVLVIPGQVHVAGLPGVHQLLFGDPGGGAGSRRLGLLLGLLGGLALLWGLAAVVVPLGGTVAAFAAGVAAALVGALLGLVLGGGLPIALPSAAALALVFGRGRGVQGGLEIGHLVVLGQVFKHDGQFPILQHLHVVFGGGSVLGEDLGDLLGLLPEILGYLMNTIFFKTQIKPPPSRPGRERPARPLVCSFLSAPVSRYGWER